VGVAEEAAAEQLAAAVEEAVRADFNAKVLGELEGICEVISGAGSLNTRGCAADELPVGAQAFCVGDNAASKISIGCGWDGKGCTM